MKLFYDVTFEVGQVFVTILTFTNYFYMGSPVMPLAINIHERKFKGMIEEFTIFKLFFVQFSFSRTYSKNFVL